MPRAKSRKRPCKVCRRWFLPDVRHQNRQKTCTRPYCQKQWHNKLCAEWNSRNKAYFKGNYLQMKLGRCEALCEMQTKKTSLKIPPARIHLHLPRDLIQDVIGIEHLVIIEYITEQLVQRHLAVIRSNPP
jgi:hypothetical protein